MEDPLVGRYFVIMESNRKIGMMGTVKYKIIPSYYLVEFWDFLSDEPGNMVIIEFREMVSEIGNYTWQFFENKKEYIQWIKAHPF